MHFSSLPIVLQVPPMSSSSIDQYWLVWWRVAYFLWSSSSCNSVHPSVTSALSLVQLFPSALCSKAHPSVVNPLRNQDGCHELHRVVASSIISLGWPWSFRMPYACLNILPLAIFMVQVLVSPGGLPGCSQWDKWRAVCFHAAVKPQCRPGVVFDPNVLV
jgi:hypothetical protein